MTSDTPPSARSLSSERLDTAVRQLMRPGVIVIDEHASVDQTQRALLAHGVHAILVLESHTGRPLGWVTSRGLLRWIGRDVALHRARDAITEPAVTVGPSASAREALGVLEDREATRLLVVRAEHGLPEGVVADVDLLRLVSREPGRRVELSSGAAAVELSSGGEERGDLLGRVEVVAPRLGGLHAPALAARGVAVESSKRHWLRRVAARQEGPRAAPAGTPLALEAS